MCKGREYQAEDLPGKYEAEATQGAWSPIPLPPERLPQRVTEHPGTPFHRVGCEAQPRCPLPSPHPCPGVAPLPESMEGALAGKEPRFCLAPLGPAG